MITSMANKNVKQVAAWQTKAKERHKDGVFLAEGVKMFEEAPEAWILEVYLSESFLQKRTEKREAFPGNGGALSRERNFWDKLERVGYETVRDEVFAKMSDTLTPQGVLTVLRQPRYRLEELLERENPLFLIGENLQDPGNLGTILRTGEGAGVTGVILSSDTVDLFNPKTIRSTMGSIYRVPFLYAEDLGAVIARLHEVGVATYAAHLQGKDYYDGYSYQGPTAFLIGNEGKGLREETARLAERYLKIPMEGRLESLNAAMAAGLLMYEAHRQRHLEKGGLEK